MINIAVKSLNLISADVTHTTIPTFKHILQQFEKVPYDLPKPTLSNLNNAMSLQVSSQRSQKMKIRTLVALIYIRIAE
jgi:hypothetical protein